MEKTKIVRLEPTTTKVVRWLRRGFHLGGLAALLWSFALWKMVQVLNGPIPEVRKVASSVDFESLLFGAASVALIIYSVVFATLGFFGYDLLRRNAVADVQAATNARFGKLEQELYGRFSLITGLILGIINESPEERTEEDRLSYLGESLQHSATAYEFLKEAGVKGQYTALNNLVYYSCALRRPQDKQFILERAEELRAFSQYNRPEPFWEGLITYCRAVAEMSDDLAAMRQAHNIASGLLTERLNDRQRNEAALYAASLRRKIHQKLESSNGANP
jgi:hypothetical protein